MPLHAIDHINIVASDLDATRSFYRDVLGFEEGPRPPFARAGAWMYLEGRPVLHISTRRTPQTRESDAFDHVAFAATDLAATRARLAERRIRFLEVAVPDREQLQIFLSDPDGAALELIFSGPEAQQAIAAGAQMDATRHRSAGQAA